MSLTANKVNPVSQGGAKTIACRPFPEEHL
jgi:hypothetical protein